jgi:hypothetical protein
MKTFKKCGIFCIQRVNEAYYVQILKRLREAVRRKRPKLWPNDWILQYDNAPAHKALSVKQFLVQKSITEMEHPPRFLLSMAILLTYCPTPYSEDVSHET